MVLTTVLVMVGTAGGQNQWTTPVLIDSAGNNPAFYDGGEMAVADSGDIYTTFTAPRSKSITVARSTDGGDMWSKYGYVDAPESLRSPQDIAIDHLGNVWLLWLSTNGGDFDPSYVNLSKSTDSGRIFTTVFRSVAWAGGYFAEKLAVDDQNSIYMLWDDRQFKLTKFQSGDIGRRTDNQIPNDTLAFASTTALTVTKDFVVHCCWVGIYFDSLNNLHEAVYNNRSNDTGITFQARVRVDTTTSPNPLFGANSLPSLAVDSAGVVYVSYTRATMLNYREIRVARSTDLGQSFGPPVVISGPDTAYDSKVCVDSHQGVNILWGAVGRGILHYRSTDEGLSFAPFASFVRIGDRGFKDGKNGFLYATGPNDSGFGFAKTNVALSISDETPAPNTFTLFQNYPNPFNPSTLIRYQLSVESNVSLRIYNLLGQVVGVLFEGVETPGSKSIRWDASGIAGGIYFYKLEAITGSNPSKRLSQVRKALLLK